MNAARNPPFVPGAARQRGQAAIIALLLVIGMGMTILIYTFPTPAKLSLERDKATATALAQAKEALIGRAASDQSMPGSLPCPDTDDDGSAELFTGSACPSYIGRLPWRTLGLSDIRDGTGERLWYALSPAFRDNSAVSPLNSDTAGQLTITGTTPAASVVAIIFAPGLAITTQDRSSSTTSTCSTTGATALNSNCAANFLDGENGNGSPPTDTNFTTAFASETFNDTLLPITSDALFRVVNIRVAKEAIAALETYWSANAYYPFANAYGSAAPYNCSSGLNRGRFPLTPSGCGQPNWTVPAFVGPDGWFYKNDWNLVTHYAISKACGQLNLGTIVTLFGTFDLDSIAAALCPTAATLEIVNFLLSLVPQPALTDEPVTVTGVSTAVRTLVIVTGRAQAAQTHPCASAAQCMEDASNTDGNAAYVKPSRFPTSNDRMALTCATNSPCSVVP